MGATYSNLKCNPCSSSSSSKRKHTPASLSSQAPSSQSEAQTHLDTVPPEVLHYVLRNLSATPRSQNWQAAVPLDDAATLLSATRITGKRRPRTVFRRAVTKQQPPDSALRHAALEAFQGLAMQWIRSPLEFDPDADSLHHWCTEPDAHLEAGTLAGDQLGLHSRPYSRRARKILSKSVPFAKNIRVSVQYRPRAWARALEKQAGVVHRLAIARIEPLFPLHRVLKPATQLKHLDITAFYLTTAQANAIGAHCTKLQSLRLECDAIWDESEPLWRGVGQSLEALTLSAQDSSYDGDDVCAWRTALAHVEQHCPHITALAFESFFTDTHTAVVSLCARYAKQLQHLRLTACFLPPRLLTQLTADCPNVRIDTQVLTEVLTPTLTALGEHLTALHISGDEHAVFLGDEKKLKEAFGMCTHLRELTVHPNDMATSQFKQMVTQLVASTKRMPQLHTMELYERYSELYAAMAAGMNSSTFASMVGELGRGTSSLKHLLLTCTCETPSIAADELTQLALANPSLETVTVRIAPYLGADGADHIDGDEDNVYSDELSKYAVDQALASIVTTFAQCPNLRSIVVDELLEALPRERLQAIDDACAQLRHRHVTVRILGQMYLA